MQIDVVKSEFLESNTFIISEGEECLIVDCGTNPAELKDKIGKKKVVGILLTHGHYDHAYFVLDYINVFNAPVYMSEHAVETLSDSNLNYGKDFTVPAHEKFVLLNREQTLKCGGFEVKFIPTPGHSKCSACFQIGEHIFAGDTVFETGIGAILNGGSTNEMIESLKKIDKIQFEILHSGHGKDSTRANQSRGLKVYIKFLARK